MDIVKSLLKLGIKFVRAKNTLTCFWAAKQLQLVMCNTNRHREKFICTQILADLVQIILGSMADKPSVFARLDKGVASRIGLRLDAKAK